MLPFSYLTVLHSEKDTRSKTILHDFTYKKTSVLMPRYSTPLGRGDGGSGTSAIFWKGCTDKDISGETTSKGYLINGRSGSSNGRISFKQDTT